MKKMSHRRPTVNGAVPNVERIAENNAGKSSQCDRFFRVATSPPARRFSQRSTAPARTAGESAHQGTDGTRRPSGFEVSRVANRAINLPLCPRLTTGPSSGITPEAREWAGLRSSVPA